jgi:hypothetical protein
MRVVYSPRAIRDLEHIAAELITGKADCFHKKGSAANS